MNIKYENKTLTINNHSVELPFQIEDLLEFGDKVIVYAYDDKAVPSDSRLLDRTIYAFDSQAHELWQIQECPHGGERPKPYMGLTKNVNNELIVPNMIGVDYIVNLENGEVEPYGNGIRPW